jgi:hypothetical protein
VEELSEVDATEKLVAEIEGALMETTISPNNEGSCGSDTVSPQPPVSPTGGKPFKKEKSLPVMKLAPAGYDNVHIPDPFPNQRCRMIVDLDFAIEVNLPGMKFLTKAACNKYGMFHDALYCLSHQPRDIQELHRKATEFLKSVNADLGNTAIKNAMVTISGGEIPYQMRDLGHAKKPINLGTTLRAEVATAQNVSHGVVKNPVNYMPRPYRGGYRGKGRGGRGGFQAASP